MEQKTYEEIVEELDHLNPDAVLWTGYEEALIGIALTFGKEPVALYSQDECIEVLMTPCFLHQPCFSY